MNRFLQTELTLGHGLTPSPACGGGLGWGFLHERQRLGEAVPPPAALRAVAEASLWRPDLRTAAKGGLCSPASGRGEVNPPMEAKKLATLWALRGPPDVRWRCAVAAAERAIEIREVA